MQLLLQSLFIIAGFTMLVKGADWFVDGASGIAAKFGIPQLVIGLTIVAMGTSAPEAAVSITAALKDNAGITIGNILGSNILNILIILGLTALIIRVPVSKSVIRFDLPYMLGISFLLLIFGYTDNEIVFWEGIVLLLFFAVYIGYMCYISIKSNAAKNCREAELQKSSISESSTFHSKNTSLLKPLIMAIIGLALIILGSNITVNAATVIAQHIGMSERFIGLTIVALGTSLPELFTSVSAALKGKADISIGNIVGSNIFNILFIVGAASIITPIPFESRFIIDAFIAILSGLVLLLLVLKTKTLEKWHGILMLVLYGGYFCYLLQ